MQLQTDRVVQTVRDQLVRVADCLHHLAYTTKILFSLSPHTADEIAAWMAAEGFGVDGDGYFTCLPRQAQHRAGTLPPATPSIFWDPLQQENPQTRRHLYALREIGPELAELHARLGVAAWIYYQDCTNACLTYPYIDARTAIPPDFSWPNYFALQSVCPEANPGREVRWVGPTIDYAGEGAILTASLPVYCGDDWVGAWSIDVPVRALMHQCPWAGHAPDHRHYLLDLDGRIMLDSLVQDDYSAPPGSAYLRTLADLGGGYTSIDLKALAARGTGHFDILDAAGTVQVVDYSVIPELDWVYLVTYPATQIPQTLVSQVQSAFARIAAGDFSCRLPDVPSPHLSELVQGFNEMATNLAVSRAERELAVEALRESQERFRRLAETNLDIIFQMDAQGILTYISPNIQTLAGYTVEDVLGCHYSTFLDPETSADALPVIQRLFDGHPIELAEFQVRQHDGAILVLEANAVPIFRKGEVVGVQGVLRNITERKAAEQRLQWDEALLRSMALSSHIGMLVVEPATDAILFFNHRFCELWEIEHLEEKMLDGAIRNQELVRTVMGLMEQPDAFVASCPSVRYREDQEPSLAELTLVDGRIIRRLDMPLRDDDGRLLGCFLLFEDVTERKHAREREHELRQMRELEHLRAEFLSLVSHELKTPLTPLIGALELLSSGTLGAMSSKQMQAVEMAERQLERLRHLITDLLDLFCLESGHLPLRFEAVDAGILVQERLEAIRPRFTAKHLSLISDCTAMQPYVSADRQRLGQVLDNLLSNAVNYTTEGGVTVCMRVNGVHLCIEVADTGAGLSPEHLERIFDRFYQAEPHLTRTHGGIGLGLALARQLVEAHGGTIRAESAGVGQGSRFIIELPLASPAEPTVDLAIA